MLVTPTKIVADITTLHPDWFSQRDIKGIIFDLDNTIMAPSSAVLEEPIRAWLHSLSQHGLRYVVVSNNPRMGYLKEAEAILQVPVLGNAGKPRRKWLQKGLDLLSLSAQQVVVIGDRPLTDIWGGNRLGTYTILVDPLTKAKEHLLVKGLRRLERLFVKPPQQP
jgi:uncharacterized protein